MKLLENQTFQNSLSDEDFNFSFHQLKELIFSCEDWIWEVDQYGVYTFFSGQGKFYLGYPKHEIPGQTLFSFMNYPQSVALQEIFFKNAKAKKSIVNLEGWYITKSGEKRCMLINAIPVKNQSEVVEGYRGAIRDITAQKDVLKTIENIAKFPEENPNPVMRVRKDGTILYCNNVGESILDFWNTGLGQKIPKSYQTGILQKVFQNGQSLEFEFTVQNSTFSFNVVPIISEGYANFYGMNISGKKNADEQLKYNEQRYKLAQIVGNIGTWDWNMEQKTLFCSEMVELFFGLQPGTFTGEYEVLLEKIYEEDRIRVIDAGKRLLKDQINMSIDFRLKNQDSSLRWVMATGSVLCSGNNKVERIMGTIQDITARKETEEKIITLSRGVEQSPASILFTNPEGQIEYVNPRFTEIMGYEFEEIKGKNPRIFKSRVHNSDFYQELWNTLTSGKDWRGEICNLKKSGDPVWLLSSICPVVDTSGTLIHYIFVGEDITQKKEQEEQIRFLALHDGLTKLPNRILFKDRLQQTIDRNERLNIGKKTALLYIDLDKFKPINDICGHDTGDIVLKVIAERITGCLRKEDTAARLGGDEFAVLYQDLEDFSDVKLLAERILSTITMPIRISKTDHQVTASIGIAIYPDHGQFFDTLLKNADIAMYKVKNSASTRIEFYTPDKI